MKKFNLKLLAPILIVSSSCYIIAENQQIPHHEQQGCSTKQSDLYDKVFHSMRSIVTTLNKALQDFFSSKNTESIVVHLEKFKKIDTKMDELFKDIKEAAKEHPALSEMVSYGDSITSQFKLFITIVNEFKLQKPSAAVSFANKLKNNIDLKKLFADIITKLEKLQTKYMTKDKNFADHLSGFLRTLRTIVNQWCNKDEATMFSELTMRMSRK